MIETSDWNIRIRCHQGPLYQCLQRCSQDQAHCQCAGGREGWPGRNDAGQIEGSWRCRLQQSLSLMTGSVIWWQTPRWVRGGLPVSPGTFVAVFPGWWGTPIHAAERYTHNGSNCPRLSSQKVTVLSLNPSIQGHLLFLSQVVYPWNKHTSLNRTLPSAALLVSGLERLHCPILIVGVLWCGCVYTSTV